MAKTTPKSETPTHKKFSAPDESRPFPLGSLQIVNFSAGTVGKLEFKPGWKWSTHVKPTAKTEWCEAPHFQYHLSGVLHVKNSDGTEFDAKPGDVTWLPSGHDAWVVGDQPVVVIDWYGTSNYAK